MESLIHSLTEKYFQILFKNFKKEQLSLNEIGIGSAQAKLTMTNLEFNEQVIQEIIVVPPQLEVQFAKVSKLDIMIPWSNLKHEPMVFSIDKINVSIAEPEEVKPMPRIWSSFMDGKKKAGAKPEKKDRNILNLKVVVKSVSVAVKIRNGCSLAVEISDLVLQSTNGKWEVVDLANATTIDKATNRELLYKQIKARSISMVLEEKDKKQYLLQDLPLTVHLTSAYSNDDNMTHQSLSIEVFLEEFNFTWNRSSWQTMMHLISGLVTCFKRHAPKSAIAAAAAPSDPPPEIAVSLLVDRWTLELKHDKDEQGFSFFGFGLKFGLVPERRTITKSGDQYIETSFEASLQTVTFRETVPSKDKDPRYGRLLCAADIAPQAGADQMLVVKVSSRYTGEEIRAAELSVVLNGVQIVLDAEVWRNLKDFVEIHEGETGAVVPAPAAAEGAAAPATVTKTVAGVEVQVPASALQVVEAAKNAKFSIAQVIQRSVLLLEVRNTVLILPNDPKDAQAASHSLQLTVGKVQLTNRPEWNTIPVFGDLLRTLPPALDSIAFTQTAFDTDVYRGHVEVQDITFDLVDKTDKKDRILHPTTLRLHTRYAKAPLAAGATHRTHQLEVAFNWGQMFVILSRPNYDYLVYIVKKYIAKIKKHFGGKAPAASTPAASAAPPAEGGQSLTEKLSAIEIPQSADALKEKVNQGMALLGQVQDKVSKEGIVADLLEDAKKHNLSAVEYGLQLFRVAVLFRADGGSFDFPLTYLTADGAADHSHDNDLTNIQFSDLAFVLENGLGQQSMLMRMGSLQSDSLDHPKSPLIFSLLPTNIGLHPVLYDKARTHNFQFYVVRNSPAAGKVDKDASQKAKPLPPPPAGGAHKAPAPRDIQLHSKGSEISIKMQGLRVVLKKKPHAPAPAAGAVVPAAGGAEASAPVDWNAKASSHMADLQAMIPAAQERIKKIVALFAAHESDLKDVKDAAAKGVEAAKKGIDYLDIHWNVEFGDNEWYLVDADDTNTARGFVKIASSNRDFISKSFSQLESNLNSAHGERDALAAKLQQLEATLAAERAAHQKAIESERNNQGVLEQVLITTKLKLAEADSELSHLRNQQLRAATGPSASPQPTPAAGKKK